MEFEKQLFVELLSEDGLVILARGLGMDKLLLKFIKLYSDPHTLVLVLNTSASQEKYFIEELLSEGVEHLPRSVTNEYSSKEREALYLHGGVLCITSRILVVDLLKKLCPVDKVAGILVCSAHRVTDSSTEAFILRLFRQDNKAGFIKAFSDAPEPFTNGFCKLERVMRNLFVRNLYLWPRFHATVSANLSRHKVDVVELRQQMSPAMTAIQMATLDIMKTCVAELKRSNPALDTEEVTVENSLSKSFDQVIKLQLDPVWNQLGAKTKQLVFDLRMLRMLLYFLTQYDCVTFYSYLESVRSSGDGRAFSSHSTWAFMEAANTLFVKSRERVFNLTASKGTSTADVELVLEVPPKWHLLQMVLGEIHREMVPTPAVGGDSGRTLVLANDERTCYQLKQYLCSGGRRLLEQQYERLVASKLPRRTAKRSAASLEGGEEEEEEEGEGLRGKRRRKAAVSSAAIMGDTATGSSACVVEACEEARPSEHDVMEELQLLELVLERTAAVAGGSTGEEGVCCRARGSARGILSEPTVLLHALNSSDNPYHLAKLLREVQPRFVVMYDADVASVRQIEVFKASSAGMALRVYFLFYDSSVEEQKYLTSLRREKEAFQQLIRERAHMVVPVEQDGRVVQTSAEPPQTATTDTKRAGGRLDREQHKVIVDMREFRSSLPSLLHKRGMDVLPLTLEVGDYILTPDICVERKSVSDLIGSLNSGRLYNQATAMTRHYQRPVLLIEFEEGKSFSLQSTSAVHSDISHTSVASKLVLLTLHFPELRVLWCPSPHATSVLFEELKAGQRQPDAEVAAAIGQDTLTSVQQVPLYSASAQDFLLKLPGINSKNCRLLMDSVQDLQELVSLTEKQLEAVLGNDSSAYLLWSFLHIQFTVASQQSGKHRGKATSRKTNK